MLRDTGRFPGDKADHSNHWLILNSPFTVGGKTDTDSDGDSHLSFLLGKSESAIQTEHNMGCSCAALRSPEVKIVTNPSPKMVSVLLLLIFSPQIHQQTMKLGPLKVSLNK